MLQLYGVYACSSCTSSSCLIQDNHNEFDPSQSEGQAAEKLHGLQPHAAPDAAQADDNNGSASLQGHVAPTVPSDVISDSQHAHAGLDGLAAWSKARLAELSGETGRQDRRGPLAHGEQADQRQEGAASDQRQEGAASYPPATKQPDAPDETGDALAEISKDGIQKQ